LEQTQAQFLHAFPEYGATAALDDLRASDYGRLDAQGHAYLDYTGSGLYADRQVRRHQEFLLTTVYGNPHSSNPTSRTATEWVERARAAVLDFFNASPAEYDVIFTPNASGALRLVGEAYPFGPDSRFVLSLDNHNSVNGIREFARAKGARFTYVLTTPPEIRLDRKLLFKLLDRPGAGHNLFAYPAQSNFTGVQHPLELIAEAQQRGWDVLLVAAAFVPTNRLDLGRWRPDFVPVSFYKIFGYPTGVGCLIARKQALRKLRRPWFAGGTIVAVSALGDSHYLAEGHEGFEDGTLNFLSLPAVEIGLEYVRSIGIDTIHSRVQSLTGWLLAQLVELRHSNGRPLVLLYGPRDARGRGATIALNLLDPGGRIVDERVIDRRAAEQLLSLRTGCFCNPGAGEVAFALAKEALVSSFKHGLEIQFDDWLAELGLPSAGAVRVSLGLVSSFGDVYRFLQFVESFRDQYPHCDDLPPRLRC
jgi:selenocysteine lyase/cysteine desulfurase